MRTVKEFAEERNTNEIDVRLFEEKSSDRSIDLCFYNEPIGSVGPSSRAMLFTWMREEINEFREKQGHDRG